LCRLVLELKRQFMLTLKLALTTCAARLAIRCGV
jgi:hypothetical protein